jgi:hypothetical protein
MAFTIEFAARQSRNRNSEYLAHRRKDRKEIKAIPGFL